MKALPTVAGLFLTLALQSFLWAGGEIASPDSGVKKPGYYRNDYFGFSLDFPQAWRIIEQRKPHEFQADGGDALGRDGNLDRETVDADQNNTHNLLKIETPFDVANGRYPDIIIIAEGMQKGAPFKTSEGFLAHTLTMMRAMRSPKITLAGLPREVTLGDRKFYRAEFSGEIGGSTNSNLYYSV